MKKDVAFQSQGAELRAWLYTPETDPPWPVVVMGHGFTATRTHMAADDYAEVFQAAGLSALLFDHYGFGDSGGEPRLQINPWIQARGYMDAITYCSERQDIDNARISLWGDSMAGAVAVAVAGIDARTAALVVQVPAFGVESSPADEDGSLYRLFKETILSGPIVPSSGQFDGPMPVVSDDQVRRPSALKPLTAYRWFIEYGGRFGSNWVNDVTIAKSDTPVGWHAGLAADYVQCPSMFVVSPEDEMAYADPDVARSTFEKIKGPKQWHEVAGGHFGLLYCPSPEFDDASQAQAKFLAEQLRHSE